LKANKRLTITDQ